MPNETQLALIIVGIFVFFVALRIWVVKYDEVCDEGFERLTSLLGQSKEILDSGKLDDYQKGELLARTVHNADAEVIVMEHTLFGNADLNKIEKLGDEMQRAVEKAKREIRDRTLRC